MYGNMTCRVDPPSFGINYGSISFGQLSGYIVFCILLIGGASPPYRYGTKHDVARKLAKRNVAIMNAKAGRIYPTVYLAIRFPNVYPVKQSLCCRHQGLAIQLETKGTSTFLHMSKART